METTLENIDLSTTGQFLVYLISHDGRPCYVGQIHGKNQTAARRFVQHCKSNYAGRQLFEAIQKHGGDHFTVKVIDRADSREELDAKEKQWIKFYDTFRCGYNGNQGGTSTSNEGRIFSEEHRRKLSESHKDNPATMRSVRAAVEARQLLGYGPRPEEVNEKIAATLTGKKHTDSRRAAQKAAALARFSDPAKKQAWLEARWGKNAKHTMSEESKAKTRAAMLAFHAKKKEGLSG